MISRHEHPRAVWVIDHMLTIYIALAVTVLVGFALWEATI